MKPLLHIGFHKTGTSLLQTHLFQPEFGFKPLKDDRRRIHSAFILPDALGDPDAALIADIRAEAAVAKARTQAFVVSHERLSGYPASRGFDQGIIAERLHATFPEGRVLIFIREQKAMLYSMYLQSISGGGTLGPARFFSPREQTLLRKPSFRLGFWHYDRVISKYQVLFGNENVLVLPFEELRNDANAIARQIIDFAGGTPDIWQEGRLSKEVNAGRPLALQALRRCLNLLTRSQLNENGLLPFPVTWMEKSMTSLRPISGLMRPLDGPLKARLRKRIATLCEGQYGASNRATADLTGLDLVGLGYDV